VEEVDELVDSVMERTEIKYDAALARIFKADPGLYEKWRA